MTEFEIIKKALTRVREGIEIYDYPAFKDIYIPVGTLCDPNVELKLEFDSEGKLVDAIVCD